MLNAANYMKNDGSADCADALQQLIDANPNRTIYFPDGTYILSHPVMTPADPKLSVSLCLSAYAVLKASDDWDSDEAMIRLGETHRANDIRTIGSNYYFAGGIVDGNGKANGISIDGGRETSIHDVSIKHTKIGIHIKPGANSFSSDADIFQVNIVGNGTPDSIRKATLDVMEKCCKYPNFVISSGCDIPPMSKWENIDAFFGAVGEFYGK